MKFENDVKENKMLHLSTHYIRSKRVMCNKKRKRMDYIQESKWRNFCNFGCLGPLLSEHKSMSETTIAELVLHKLPNLQHNFAFSLLVIEISGSKQCASVLVSANVTSNVSKKFFISIVPVQVKI